MDRYQRGAEVRREVLGDEHVARTEDATTDFDRDFRNWVVETAWGGVWSRPQLDHRTRSLITIAILAATGQPELELHLEAARRTGATPEDIAETFLHVGVYAGVPAANSAFSVAKRIYEEGADD